MTLSAPRAASACWRPDATVRVPRGTAPLLFAATALLLAAVLAWIGNALTAQVLERHAERAAAAYARGHSPWRWQPRRARDVVAQRVFGAGTLRPSAAGLQLRLDTPQPVQIGLPLSVPMDFVRLPRLRLQLDAGAPIALALAGRQTLDGPAYYAPVTVLKPGAATLDLAIDTLPWVIADQRVPPPARFAMLRLTVQGAPGATLTLRRIELLPPAALPRGIAALAAAQSYGRFMAMPPQPTPALPVVMLPPALDASAMLTARDRIQARAPAAVIVPRGDLGTVLAAAVAGPPSPTAATPPLLPLGLALLALGVLLWPPRLVRLRALVEAGVALVPAAWLIVGMRYDGRINRADATLIAVGLIYAAALEWRTRPRDWTLLAPVRTWAVPMLPALAALLAWTVLHGATPEPLAALRYLGWALLQQFMLQVVVARRLQVAGNREAATLATATLFALLHAPNTPLMLLTFAGGLLWTAWFLRRRALLPVALAHAAAALLIGGLVAPDAWLRSLEVGARYLR